MKYLEPSEINLQIAYVHANDSLHGFFNSVVPYFLNDINASKDLLELKFRELLLNVVSNPQNREVCEYFSTLLTDSSFEDMRKIMEVNFTSNLRMDEFARLCGKSLSAFKRDFQKQFRTTPGRWLLDRRLQHAQLLLNTSGGSISEIAFECGFENASHFSRAFKDRFGQAPAHHRKVPA